ncbi:MAG: hypothetical protein ABH887_01640 [bacterium]
MILTIDISSKPKLVLTKEGKEISYHQWDGLYQLSETLLIEIDKFLKKNQVDLAQIKKIDVVPSEESIVSTRIAKATVLALMQK